MTGGVRDVARLSGRSAGGTTSCDSPGIDEGTYSRREGDKVERSMRVQSSLFLSTK